MGLSNSHLMSAKFSEKGETDGIKYAIFSMQGNCGEMEDTFAAVPDLDGTHTSFFGVYDGHGGGQVAKFCAEKFHNELLAHQDYHQNPVNAVQRVFFRMDELIGHSDEWRRVVNPGGCIPFLNMCFACVVLLKGNQIIIGNAGSSCCVVSKNDGTMTFTTSPSPSDPNEAARIQSVGGHVITEHWRIKNPHHRLGGLVALNRLLFLTLPISRSIGDLLFKQNKHFNAEEQMVTCDPEIRTVEATPDTEFIIIASDGVRNCMSYDWMAHTVRERLRDGDSDLLAICKDIVHRCCYTYVLRDNMTIIIIQFKRVAADAYEASSLPDAAKGVESANLAANTESSFKDPSQCDAGAEDANPDDERHPLLA